MADVCTLSVLSSSVCYDKEKCYLIADITCMNKTMPPLQGIVYKIFNHKNSWIK